MKPWSRRRGRELLGIDFSGNNLKLARARISSNKRILVNVVNRDIKGLTDDAISKVIKDAVSELDIQNARIVNIIPSHTVITKNIEIPSTNPQEIKEIINLQASRYTPYSREEIIVDYIDIDIYKHSYTKILLVIVARNIVKRQFEILHKAGIKLESILFAPECMALFVPKTLKVDTKSKPVSIIHVEEDFSDFIVVFKDKPVFIRNIPMGAAHILRGEEDRLKFAEEIKSSLEGYQSEDIKETPSELILATTVEDVKGLESTLSSNLHLPLKVTQHFKDLLTLDRGFKMSELSPRLSFLNVVASLFSRDEVKINLIPEETKLRKSLEERGRELIKTGIFILTIFVLVFSTLISKIYFKSTYLDNLNTKYKSLNEEARKLEDDFVKVSLIKNYLQNRGYSLEVLVELYDVTPYDLELNDIRFDYASGKFTVKGTAASMSTVFSFVDNMESSDYFKDVKTRYTTKRKDGTVDVTDFEVVCLLDKEEII